MKTTRTWGICAIASLALVATLLIEWLQPQNYSVGMMLPPAALGRPGMRVERYGVDLGGIPEKEIGSTAVAGVYDPNCGLYLEVNSSNRIVKVQRWKWIGIDFLGLAGRLKQIFD